MLWEALLFPTIPGFSARKQDPMVSTEEHKLFEALQSLEGEGLLSQLLDEVAAPSPSAEHGNAATLTNPPFFDAPDAGPLSDVQ